MAFPFDVDLASKPSKEEDAIQVTERLDDEIRGPLSAASVNTKYDIFKAANSIVLCPAEIPSREVMCYNLLGCFVGAYGSYSRLAAGCGSVT